MACARFFGLAAAATLLAGLAVGAQAETFKWIDAQGKVQYGDRIPPEAVNRGNVELSKQGVAKKVVEPALTPEQRRAMEERAEQLKAVQKAERDRQLQDNALVSSYTSENDIDVARRRNLALVGAAILSAEARIKALQRRAAVLEREKLFYEKKPFPEKLKRELASVQIEIPKQYELISQKNEEALEINRRYEAQKQKFAEIKGRMRAEAQAAQAGQAGPAAQASQPGQPAKR
jgi:hypothetical protein